MLSEPGSDSTFTTFDEDRPTPNPLPAWWGTGPDKRQMREPLRDAGAVNHETSVIVRWLEAGDRGDVDTFDDLLHVDAVIHAPRGLSTDSREAEKAVWLAAIAAMPDLRHEVQEVIVQDDVEMARVVVTGTLVAEFGGIPGSNKSFTMDQAVICHLRAGKIAEAWEIADVGSLSDQVT